ncbi:hypothetical protein NL676_021641 [Syzygium grande]|nr:hypothetical protein NL676_021641 [Syzygium grande]
MAPPHFLLVVFPGRGAINPALQLAKRLTHFGGHVTFFTTVSAIRHMIDPVFLEAYTFTTFSDGYDDGIELGDDVNHFIVELKRRGSEALKGFIECSSGQGLRFSCVLNTMIPWADYVARSLQIPSVLVWIQPATVFSVYYHYFNGYEDVIKNLKEGANPKVVLVNTFDVLELEVLRLISTLNLVGVGPLVSFHFLDVQDHNSSDKSSKDDLYRGSEDYVQWLNTKEEGSVIYVAFGSISKFSKAQKREMARGLLETGAGHSCG